MKNRKLFLASFTAYVVDELVRFINVDPVGCKVAFITTAADLYKDKWFVDKDRDAFIKWGFAVTDIDIKNKNKEELYNTLKGFKVVAVAGGYVYYLLEKVLESGFDTVLNKLLANGLIYAGGSAGAVLVGPSLKPIESLDDPTKAPSLKSHDGLGLVNFVGVPHAGQEKYKDRLSLLLKKFEKSKYEIIPLSNFQAVEVVGNKYKIVGKL